MTREQQVKHIRENPERYVVCAGCGSIVYRHNLRACPHCSAYRFSTAPEAVIAQTAKLALVDG